MSYQQPYNACNTSSDDSSYPDEKKSGSNTGLIVGGAVAFLTLVGAVVGIAVCCCGGAAWKKACRNLALDGSVENATAVSFALVDLSSGLSEEDATKVGADLAKDPEFIECNKNLEKAFRNMSMEDAMKVQNEVMKRAQAAAQTTKPTGESEPRAHPGKEVQSETVADVSGMPSEEEMKKIRENMPSEDEMKKMMEEAQKMIQEEDAKRAAAN